MFWIIIHSTHEKIWCITYERESILDQELNILVEKFWSTSLKWESTQATTTRITCPTRIYLRIMACKCTSEQKCILVPLPSYSCMLYLSVHCVCRRSLWETIYGWVRVHPASPSCVQDSVGFIPKIWESEWIRKWFFMADNQFSFMTPCRKATKKNGFSIPRSRNRHSPTAHHCKFAAFECWKERNASAPHCARVLWNLVETPPLIVGYFQGGAITHRSASREWKATPTIISRESADSILARGRVDRKWLPEPRSPFPLSAAVWGLTYMTSATVLDISPSCLSCPQSAESEIGMLGFVKVCWFHSSTLPGQGRVNGKTIANSRNLNTRFRSMAIRSEFTW